uniref:Uncharacterized protein n=1 Tax=Cacopsylla melanoneura TaxID=428564 RepID=A0A8D8Z2T5_9HEMI
MSSKNSDNESSRRFNKHLMETEQAFKQMTLKNEQLDDQIVKLRMELEIKKTNLHEAHNTLLSMNDENEAEKTILLSLRRTVRLEREKGEMSKKKLEKGNKILELCQDKEREIIEKFEQDTAVIIEQFQQNEQNNSTQEIELKVTNVKQHVEELQQKKQRLVQKIKTLQTQLSHQQNNSGWEGLDQVYAELKALPQDELDLELAEEKYLLSTLKTLMGLYNQTEYLLHDRLK